MPFITFPTLDRRVVSVPESDDGAVVSVIVLFPSLASVTPPAEIPTTFPDRYSPSSAVICAEPENCVKLIAVVPSVIVPDVDITQPVPPFVVPWLT
jgi:hypothetical protein